MFNKNPQKDGASLIQDLRQSFDSFVPAKQPGSSPRMPGGPPTCSIIDACLAITGNLQSDRDVQVDGQITGDVHCSHLTVSKDGTINGNIVAEEVVIRGKVKGTIRALQIVLQDSAHVESEIFHNSLIIEQGAVFDGQSHRQTDPRAQAGDLRAIANMKPAGEGKAKPGKSERAA
jgi:cytoskeletal protein CcmA (bactofilin family)